MRPTFIFLCFAAMAMLTSCVSKKKFLEMEGERNRISQNLEETQTQVKGLEEEKENLMATYQEEKTKLNGEITGLKSDVTSAQTEAANAAKEAAAAGDALKGVNDQIDAAFNSYETSGLMLEEVNDAIYLKTSAPVLFGSGSVRLGSDDRGVIDSLAALLTANPDLEVTVEGHTDDAGVKAGASFRDNWDLSYRRANAVVRHMLKAGVNPAQLAAAARGEYKPLTDDRAQNRRVVFRISPKLSSLYNAAKAN